MIMIQQHIDIKLIENIILKINLPISKETISTHPLGHKSLLAMVGGSDAPTKVIRIRINIFLLLTNTDDCR